MQGQNYDCSTAPAQLAPRCCTGVRAGRMPVNAHHRFHASSSSSKLCLVSGTPSLLRLFSCFSRSLDPMLGVADFLPIAHTSPPGNGLTPPPRLHRELMPRQGPEMTPPNSGGGERRVLLRPKQGLAQVPGKEHCMLRYGPNEALQFALLVLQVCHRCSQLDKIGIAVASKASSRWPLASCGARPHIPADAESCPGGRNLGGRRVAGGVA